MVEAASHANPILFISYNERNESHHNDLFSQKSRRVLILYVGGTIGMTRMPNGALEPRKGYLTQEVKKMKELQERPEIAPFDIIEYDELLDSSDMDGRDYVRIAKDVERHYDDYDGFLVLHGTDTMHYTASALSFLLMNLVKPVILTGAMVPLVEPQTDARRNLVISLMLASSTTIQEVCVFFKNSLLRGNCCCKLNHTTDAFCSPNYPPLGVVDSTGFHLNEAALLPQPSGPLQVLSNMKGTVMVFMLCADCDMELMMQLLMDNGMGDEEEEKKREEEEEEAKTKVQKTRNKLMDAVVLEVNGVGELSSECSVSLRRLAAAARTHDIVVCVTVREPYGTLSPTEVQRLHEIAPDLIYLRMTTSAAETKLMYLFGRGLLPSDVREIMPRNLRGEIVPGASFEANL